MRGKATLVPEVFFLILSSSQLDRSDRSNAPEFSLASRCRSFAARGSNSIAKEKKENLWAQDTVMQGFWLAYFQGEEGYFWKEFCVSKMFGFTFGSDFASGNFECLHCIVKLNSLNITIWNTKHVIACVAGGLVIARSKIRKRRSRESKRRSRASLGLRPPAPDSRGFAAYEFLLRAPTRPQATQASNTVVKWTSRHNSVSIL